MKRIQFSLLLLFLTFLFCSGQSIGQLIVIGQNEYLDNQSEKILDIYKTNTNFDQAIELSKAFMDTLQYFDNIDQDLYQLQSLHLQSSSYRRSGKDSIAFHLLLKGYNEFDFSIKTPHLVHANYLLFLANYYDYRQESHKAQILLKQAEKIMTHLDYPFRKAHLYSVMSMNYLQLGNETLAMSYIKKIEDLDEIATDSAYHEILNLTYAKYYFDKNNSIVLKYLENAINYDNNDESKLFTTKKYSEALAKHRKHKEAYEALLKFNIIKDRINTKDLESKINTLETKLNYKENLTHLERLKLQNRLNIEKDELQNIWIFITSTLTLILIISLIIIYRNLRRQKDISLELISKNEELSESKRIAEELSEVKSKFTENVTHELRTPLHGIIGLTSILISDEKENISESGKHHLNSLKSSGDYLLNLINDVLEISKMDADKIEIEKGPFKLSLLVDNIANSFKYNINDQVDFKVEIDDNLPDIVLGDSVRLSQIMINLVGNSVKFTKKGEISIRVINVDETKDSCQVKFEISDTGIGIAKKNQKLIFDKFSQIKTTKSTYSGTGLGLAIVQEVLNKLDSEIHLKSEVGSGSLFWFCITFEKPPIENEIEQPYDSLFLIDEMYINKKILIVDDNEVNLVVTKHLLESNQFIVETAINGKQAVEFFEKTAYDLVLMDLHMPGLNGIEATELIRESDVETPVVLLTASNMTSDWHNYKTKGFNDFVIKPYDKFVFLQKILRNLK